jgi:hypothetical protein
MSYFGLKIQIFFKECEWRIVYFKLEGRKKSLEGCTLAMSGLEGWADPIVLQSIYFQRLIF